MKTARSLSSTIALALCSAVVGVTLTACTPQVGSLSSQNGGTKVTVPALWVDAKNNVGGTENATVWVGHDSVQQFEVRLADLNAQGAGAAWQAASASAAAVGTLMSGVDPTDLAFNFGVTGKIDGPSAGGILTVGVLAAIRQTPLKPGITMTGTISPDGSLGIVAGIGAKMKGASEKGYKLVLLPRSAANNKINVSGVNTSYEDYGQSLGISVQYVDNVAQAYEIFTGNKLIPSTGATYQASQQPAVLAAQQKAANAQLADARRQLNTLGKSHPAYSSLVSELEMAEQSAARGKVSEAFGVAVDVLNQAARANGKAEITRQISERGLSSARTNFLDLVNVNIAKISEREKSVSTSTQGMSPSQVISTPSALTWLSYAKSVLTTMSSRFTSPSNDATQQEAELIEAAGVVATELAGVNSTFEQSLTVIAAMPADNATLDTTPAQHLSNYTTFLKLAAEKNRTYVIDALRVRESDLQRATVTSLLPTLVTMYNETSQIDTRTETLDQEIIDAADVLTFYGTTSVLVSATQALQLEGVDLTGEFTTSNLATASQVILSSASLVHEQANWINAKGLNPSYGVWSTDWAVSSQSALSRFNRAGAGTANAMNEIWFDAASQFMLGSLLSPR